MHCLTWRGEKQTERANGKGEMTRETEWEQQILVAVAIESEREERERQVRDGCEKERLRREEERDSKNREKNPEHKDAHLDPGWLNAFQTRPIGRASEKKKKRSRSKRIFKCLPSERVWRKVAGGSWWLLGAWSGILRWLAWNSGGEGKKGEKTYESMWKALSDNITYWKLSYILAWSECFGVS